MRLAGGRVAKCGFYWHAGKRIPREQDRRPLRKPIGYSAVERSSNDRLPAPQVQTIRIVLVNDHPAVRTSLRLLLGRERTLEVIGEAASAREAAVLIEYTRPDVVLLDVQLSHRSGIGAAREMLSKNPKLGIVFLSAREEQEYVSEALKAGARGYVLADSAQTDLAAAVRAVAGGKCFLSPRLNHPDGSDFRECTNSSCDDSEFQKRSLM